MTPAEQFKKAVLTHLSHEMRIPLHNILAGIELLGDEKLGPLNSRQRDYISFIEKNSRQLLQMANDTLDMARLEAGKVVLSRLAVPLRPLLAEVVCMMTPLLEHKCQSCLAQVDEGVPETMQADSLRLKQILINLVSNAHKFSPSGTPIQLRCRLHQANELCFEVRDCGPGMPAGQADHLLAPFVQGEASADGTPIPGVGLGLSLVKHLAELHQGRLEISSEPGQGSLFSVFLPLSP